jgi:SAM-dependent methyltransferase
MKRIAKSFLNSLGFEVRRRPKDRSAAAIKCFVQNGRVPWSQGYNAAKQQLITETMSTPEILELFRISAQLPEKFGVGIDERCVEYPWLFSRIGTHPIYLLDAGSALNHTFIVNSPALREKKVDIVTLNPEDNCFWKQGISYIFGDLRDLPLRNGIYDAVVCISTLEHVGLDNRRYSSNKAHRESAENDLTIAVREMARVLKRGGAFYLTVPFGKYQKFRSFQQFDAGMLKCAIDSFGIAQDVETTYYRYSAGGWNLAAAGDCINSEYVGWLAAVWDGASWPNPITRETDLAAASRSIACVRIVK